MASLEDRTELSVRILMALTESEARALRELCETQPSTIINCSGTPASLQGHRLGLDSLFCDCRRILPGELAKVDAARKALQGDVKNL